MNDPRELSALIVDDHARIRKYLKEIFLDSGTFKTVEVAADASVALDLFFKNDFDLAVVDIDLPGMDGFSLIEIVKNRKPEQSFLVLSAIPVSEYAMRAHKLGASRFLPKGCRPSTILAAALRAVGR